MTKFANIKVRARTVLGGVLLAGAAVAGVTAMPASGASAAPRVPVPECGLDINAGPEWFDMRLGGYCGPQRVDWRDRDDWNRRPVIADLIPIQGPKGQVYVVRPPAPGMVPTFDPRTGNFVSWEYPGPW